MDIDLKKDNSKLEGRKAILESYIMHFTKCLLM